MPTLVAGRFLSRADIPAGQITIPREPLPDWVNADYVQINGKSLRDTDPDEIAKALTLYLQHDAEMQAVLNEADGTRSHEQLLTRDLKVATVLFSKKGFKWESVARIQDLIVKLEDKKSGTDTSKWRFRGTCRGAVDAQKKLIQYRTGEGDKEAQAARTFIEDMANRLLNELPGFDVAALFPVRGGDDKRGDPLEMAVWRKDRERWRETLNNWERIFRKDVSDLRGKAPEHYGMLRSVLDARSSEPEIVSHYERLIGFAVWQARCSTWRL